MDAKQLLFGRINSLSAALNRARLQIGEQEIPQSLRKRAGNELVNSIREEEEKLRDDCECIEALRDSDDAQLLNSWQSFDLHQTSCEKVLRECLAFREGIRMRAAASPETELCEIADALLDELSGLLPDLQWKRFSYVAASESFTDFTQMIRMRFPLEDIWNLPTAAHEYGHFLSFRLNPVDKTGSHHKLFEEYLAQETAGNSDSKWMWLNEFFADIFATWALGPAFAFTCVVLRFSPVAAWISRDTYHPPDAQRVIAITEAMEQMGDLSGPASRVKEFWMTALEGAGQSDQPNGQGRQILNIPISPDAVPKIAERICKMLSQGAPDVKYKSWSATEGLKDVLKNVPKKLPAFRIADLLNAAWRLRLTPQMDSEMVNKSFLEVWRGKKHERTVDA
jgi:hypothetical protein